MRSLSNRKNILADAGFEPSLSDQAPGIRHTTLHLMVPNGETRQVTTVTGTLGLKEGDLPKA